MWIATAAGVAFFDGSSFTVHNTTTHPGLADNSINAIAVAADGSIWAGTDFRGERVRWVHPHHLHHRGRTGERSIRNIKQAPNGDVWIGTVQGATRYDGNVFTSFGQPRGYPLVGEPLCLRRQR